MKIAVTGYRGFIASNLLRELRDDDLSLIEQEDYPPHERVKGTDAIVHLGAIAGARADATISQYIDYNVKRTGDLLESARLAGTRKFIFISTCTVSHGVKNVYDLSKLQAEQWCDTYRNHIDDITVLRLYNVYGTGETKSVIAKFVSAVRNGTSIEIHGDGKQTRDFIHVDDVVGAIMKVLHSREKLNRAFEVGTGRETSIIGLAELIFRISGKKVPIVYSPMPYAQLEHAKCPEPLFVQNPIPLEEGLKRLLKNGSRTLRPESHRPPGSA